MAMSRSCFSNLRQKARQLRIVLILTKAQEPFSRLIPYKRQPKFTVPLHTSFFSTTFGRQLIGGQNNRRVPTSRALRNSRLIGLYFASQWVDACQNFTPLLAETYNHLKQVRPVHGLEVVFVSTDRDPGSFESLFSSMPWHAIPFDQSQMIMENLSRT